MNETFSSLEHFYSGNPARRRSPEALYGVHWRLEGWPGTWQVSYVRDTGEVYARRQGRGAGPLTVLGAFPADPDAGPSDVYYRGAGPVPRGLARTLQPAQRAGLAGGTSGKPPEQGNPPLWRPGRKRSRGRPVRIPERTRPVSLPTGRNTRKVRLLPGVPPAAERTARKGEREKMTGIEMPLKIGSVPVTYRPAREILTRATGFMDKYDFTLNPYSPAAPSAAPTATPPSSAGTKHSRTTGAGGSTPRRTPPSCSPDSSPAPSTASGST